MKKSTIITLCILLIILLIAAFFVYRSMQNSDKRALETSEAAGIFANSTTTANFTDFNGNDANLDQFLGKTLIVNSWASWAPSSVEELKLLTSVAKKYRDQDVVVIAINRAETRRTAESFLKTLGLSDEVLLIVDVDDRYYKAIDGFTMPETLVYDKRGEVVAHKKGAITEAELTLFLRKALLVGEE